MCRQFNHLKIKMTHLPFSHVLYLIYLDFLSDQVCTPQKQIALPFFYAYFLIYPLLCPRLPGYHLQFINAALAGMDNFPLSAKSYRLCTSDPS